MILVGLFGLFSYQLRLVKYWAAFLCGLIWIFVYISWQNSWMLPAELEGIPVATVGKIANVPQIELATTHFLFAVDHFEKPFIKFIHSGLVSCSWQNAPKLKAGDKWQLHLKLKKIHGAINPGGFDYAAWAFAHGILATGWVDPHQTNLQLNAAIFSYGIARVRQNLAEKIDLILNQSAIKGLIKALVVGDQSSILAQQWQVLRQTGTNHLFAIAGLHIGFAAHLMYRLCGWFSKRSLWLTLRISTPLVSAFAALCSAVVYSALAGFALPTKRAVIMLAVFLITKIRRRYVSFSHGWFVALGIILLINPLQILTESFWLSFVAVGSLIYGFHGQIQLHPHCLSAKLIHGIKTQWITSVALIPLTLLLFQQASLVSFFANFIAIPWIGFLVAPLCLLSGLLLLDFPTLGTPLLKTANFLLASFWPILQKISIMPNSQWYQVVLNPWMLISATIAILLLLAPKGFPARWLALIWLLPLLFYLHKKPEFGAADFTLLDVGQGLSAVIATTHHVLVFDAGAHRNHGVDAGEAVVLPFLRWFHLNRIDILMISHGDNDHIGGAATLLQMLPVEKIITSVPERFASRAAFSCVAGQTWRWDGVNFEVLSPLFGHFLTGNNSSCVLKVTTPKHSVLLTGDIEKEAEKILLNAMPEKLAADVLIAPHHGSKTSSTEEFINAVHPSVVLFPVGYRNQYHLPSPLIVKRYQEAGAKLYDSVRCGSIEVELNLSDDLPVHCYREEHQRFWREKF